jgi:hypothetical protein
MNLSQFFEHWKIVENPFRGEEARHDTVFARMGLVRGGGEPVRTAAVAGAPAVASGEETAAGSGAGGAQVATFHSDFEKILGDPARPSTSIVFGEKGSGKTAIRLQIAERVAAHNARHPQSKVLMVAYDDLNAVLDRYYRKVGGKSPQEALAKFRLVDHIDAIVGQVVPRVVDGVLGAPDGSPPEHGRLELGPDPRRAARRFDGATKRDLLLLQAVYDRPDTAERRTARLRRALKCGLPAKEILWNALAWLGWVPAAALFAYARLGKLPNVDKTVLTYAFAVLLGLWLLVLGKRLAWDNLALMSMARRVRRQLRVAARSDVSVLRSLRQLDPSVRDAGHLPIGETDEARYAMLDRLRRVLAQFGYTGMMVVIDRVDEPTLISGDPERMRAVIWPLLNNKFLQQHGLGVKMLLPIELRHALFKESSAFFQEARLDKQNLVERLSWTGSMLYDLCDARLKACREPGAGPIGLLDLFAEDVTGKDLVDGLDQMHQPRDAFKFLYRCMGEHCSNVTAEQAQWKIPRLVLETVRKQESDRVQQLYRGIRPA